MGLFVLLMRTGLDREDRNTHITPNPYAAELFRNIFHSFEAGIAPNDEKMYIDAKIYFFKI